MRNIETVPRLANGEVDFRQLEQKPSKLKWIIMTIIPIVLFVATLFLGRFTVTVQEVMGIFGKHLGFDVVPFWSETAETVIMRVTEKRYCTYIHPWNPARNWALFHANVLLTIINLSV